MAEVPATFTYDCEGELAHALSQPQEMMEQLAAIEGSVLGTRCPTFLTGCAELVIPDPYSGDGNYMRHLAFYQAGATVLAGFFESDLPDDYKPRTISQLALRQVPLSLIQNTHDDRLRSMRDFALETLAKHPELRSITEPVLEYHIETFQVAGVGDCSIAGAGFTAHQLDKAWGAVQEQLFGYQLDNIDWDELEG